MTREEILAKWDGMTPRERDALVAEKVMGWTDFYGALGREPGYHHRTVVKFFSTDISAAMEAEGKVIEQNHQKMCEYVRQLMSVMSLDETDRHLSTFAKLLRSTPEQRCKAALLAVMDT